MIQPSRMRNAGEYVEWLRLQVHDRQLPATSRVRASIGCLGLTLEHHHSIVLLVEHQLYGSAYALLRVAFESYLRGVWLSACATDALVEEFLRDRERPSIDNMLAQLESTPAFSENVLSRVKASAWSAMCDFTHTGGIHVQRRNTAEAIEPNYDANELENVLSFAEVLGSLAVIGLAHFASDDDLGMRVLEQLKMRTSHAA